MVCKVEQGAVTPSAAEVMNKAEPAKAAAPAPKAPPPPPPAAKAAAPVSMLLIFLLGMGVLLIFL